MTHEPIDPATPDTPRADEGFLEKDAGQNSVDVSNANLDNSKEALSDQNTEIADPTTEVDEDQRLFEKQISITGRAV